MNQEVRYEGTDITSHVISYTRSQNICSGIGIVDITTTFHYVSGDPWDTVLVYEDGNKKGTYNVISLEDSIPDGTTIIHCQDNSLRLVDTFITDSYKITYVSYARYWIEKFLTEAGVSYSFSTTDNGSPIAKDTVLGLNPAYDIIVTLLQQSGWYIYFNKNGTAVVGDLVAGSGTKATIHDTDIINIDSNKNDSKLRNRAVVWGAGNALDNTWTFADVYRHTPWDIDSNDKRTVVLANSSVDSTYFANVLANKMLDEFARLDHIITAQLHGSYSYLIS